MRILLVSNMYPSAKYPYYGIFVKKIAGSLQERGAAIERTVVIRRKHRSKWAKAPEYILFYIKILLHGVFGKQDIIYAHYPSHCSLPLLWVKAVRPKAKIIVHFHGSDVMQITNPRMIGWLRKLLQDVELVVAPSAHFAPQISEKYGVEMDKIMVSPSGGVDVEQLRPVPVRKDSFSIGYLSRIDKGKGWNLLLDALSEMNRSQLDFRTLIGGDGRDRELMLQEIKDNGLADKVEYLGTVPPNELNTFYNQLDVFVFPTELRESLGLVGLEAMACGVPLITSDSGGQLSYARNGENGYVFSSGNTADLVNCLIRFQQLSHLEKDKMAVAARKMALNYDEKIVSRQLFEAFQKVYEPKQ